MVDNATTRRNQRNQPLAPATAAAPTTTPSSSNGVQGISTGISGAINGATSGLRGVFKPPPAPAPALPPVGYVPPVSGFGNNANVKNGPQLPSGYNPTTAPFGFDQSQPGQLQQLWTNNQGMWFDTPGADWANEALDQFKDPWAGQKANTALMSTIAQPGAGQQHWNGVQGDMNTMSGAESSISGGYKGPNNAQTAFNATMGALPGSMQPQFDAYYDRMKQKAMSDVNAQSAARGSYGSNAALNNSIGAGIDIEAQRAKAATDFMLEDSANQRSWFDSAGNIGRSADLSGQGAFQKNIDAANYGLDKTKSMSDMAFRSEEMDFNKNKALSDIAFGVDDGQLKRLQTGIETGLATDAADLQRLESAARTADNVDTGRNNQINGLFDRLSGFSNDVVSFLQENGDQLINADGTANESAIDAMIAQTADERGYDQYETERFARDVKDGIKLATGATESAASGSFP